jgi:hypothetical protein
MATKSLNKSAVDPRVVRWKREGRTLRVSQHQWVIADWILRGMKLFKSKKKAYDAAVNLTGMTRETLQQFKMTAEFFPSSTRVKGLSFGHHRLVANRKYTPAQRNRYLLYAKNESVDSFASYLRGLDQDAARRADHRTPADKAADAVADECARLIRNCNFSKLLNTPPSQGKQTDLVDALKKAAAELNAKAEMLVTTWRRTDVAFQQNKKAKGVGAGR